LGAIGEFHDEVDGDVCHNRHLLILHRFGVEGCLENNSSLRLIAGQEGLTCLLVDRDACRQAVAVNGPEMLVNDIQRYVLLEARLPIDRDVDLLRFARPKRDGSRTDVDRLEVERITNGNRMCLNGIVGATSSGHVDFLQRLGDGSEVRCLAVRLLVLG